MMLRRNWLFVVWAAVVAFLIARGLWFGVLLSTAGLVLYGLGVGGVLVYQRFANRNAKPS